VVEGLPTALRYAVQQRSQPKASPDARAAAAQPEAQAETGGKIAASVVLLAGVVALAVERVPEWVGWTIALAGASWLLAETLRRRR
jgi:hypothetical protein